MRRSKKYRKRSAKPQILIKSPSRTRHKYQNQNGRKIRNIVATSTLNEQVDLKNSYLKCKKLQSIPSQKQTN